MTTSQTRLDQDTNSAFLAGEFAKTCETLQVRHKRTRPYTPRTNGKAERFIQTLCGNGRIVSRMTAQRNANDGCRRTCISTTTIALTQLLGTIRQSVAWIRTTS